MVVRRHESRRSSGSDSGSAGAEGAVGRMVAGAVGETVRDGRAAAREKHNEAEAGYAVLFVSRRARRRLPVRNVASTSIAHSIIRVTHFFTRISYRGVLSFGPNVHRSRQQLPQEKQTVPAEATLGGSGSLWVACHGTSGAGTRIAAALTE